MTKYRAKPIVVDGIRFASQKEARRYAELKLLEKAGEIHGIHLQPRYPLYAYAHAGRTPIKVGEYRADFEYCRCRWPKQCKFTAPLIEDVKGFRTPLYKWKKRHVEAQYGITVVEV